MLFLLFLKNLQNTILVQSWLKPNCFRFLHFAWSTHNNFGVCQNVLITTHTYFMAIVLMDINIYDSNFPKMSESRKRKYSCYQKRKTNLMSTLFLYWDHIIFVFWKSSTQLFKMNLIKIELLWCSRKMPYRASKVGFI